MAQNDWGTLDTNSKVKTAEATIDDRDENLRTCHAGATAPASPVLGMLWLDTTNNELKIYSGSVWHRICQFKQNCGLVSMADAVVNTNTPSGATSHQLELTDGVTTYYIPVYAAASSWTV